MNEELIAQIRQKAREDGVPIMDDEGIDYVADFLKRSRVDSLLEIGTAVGYSAIVFASCSEDLHIVTLENDEQRYRQAVENIAEAGLKERITPILTDARQYHLEGKFRCLFLDGPKAHNAELLKIYQDNLTDDGIIIVDDVYLYGILDDPGRKIKRRLRPLVQKLRDFREGMLSDPAYESTYLQIGDGLLICKKRENKPNE
ncbi:MAG: O-methyltransferase [Erysipelotrichaceae bacterium]|nr:O-methyltransferase [Erysipelotrichaceae bacterium]